jgi:hypothetical protein
VTPRLAASVPNPTAVPAAAPAACPPTGPAVPNDPAIAAPDAAVAAADAAWSMRPLRNSPPMSMNEEMVELPTGAVFPAAAGIAPAVRMSSRRLRPTEPPRANILMRCWAVGAITRHPAADPPRDFPAKVSARRAAGAPPESRLQPLSGVF